MSLLFKMLFRLVITFLPRSKHLLISWLQSPSAVILELKKIKSVTVSIVSPSAAAAAKSLQSCLTLCDPMDCSMSGLPVHHQLPELLKLMSVESVMPSNHLILCCPLPLLPSIFPSIRVFSNESVLCIRWPKYWSFSFNISPSNEYSGLISFRVD